MMYIFRVYKDMKRQQKDVGNTQNNITLPVARKKIFKSQQKKSIQKYVFKKHSRS